MSAPTPHDDGGPGEDLASRLLSREQAVARFGPGRGFRLAFTNGCFDGLHEGHRALLARAADLGDRLLVGLNSDRSVRRLKGPDRPATPEPERVRALLDLDPVDAVTVFDEDTPLALIEALSPDVLVKGADYPLEDIVGREVVEAGGGRVIRIPLVPGVSTTEILRRGRAPG